jgi:hypothetical protein
VIPRSEDPAVVALADKLQARLHGLVAATLPGKAIDVRPRPERVCPRVGCNAITAGVLLLHHQQGCVAVALLAGSGPSATHLFHWIGDIKLETALVPFREPPESQVTVDDYLPCGEVVDALAAGEPQLQAALERLSERNVLP